jgi:hypothetical protein
VEVGPIPVVGFVDMCIRMARTMTKWQIASVIDRGVFERLVTICALEGALATRHRHPWTKRVGDAIALVHSGSVGTRSASEDLLLEGLLAAGVIEPVVNTRGSAGVVRDEPDFVWPGHRVNVEVDGWHHREPAQAADDAARDAAVAGVGIRVIRIRAVDVWKRRPYVVAQVLQALGGEAVELEPGSRYLRCL